MLWFRLALLTLGLSALQSACDPYKPTPRSAIRSNADSKSGGANTLASGGSLTDIVLVSPRLGTQAGTYQAVAKLGGFTTAKIPLLPDQNGLTFEAAGLPVNSPDVLVVEIYEGESLKFIAKRAATQLAANSSAPVRIDDCLLLSAPWDGLKSEGGCNWEIEEVK